MEKFTTHTGVAVPLTRSNVDTDQIIPARYLKRVSRTGFEDGLFSNWRETEPGFVLNQDAYRNGSVLFAGPDFGTGSSREQAATALKYAGVPVVLAGSFSDVFKRNAINNGLICLQCPELVEELTAAYAKDGARGQGGKGPGEISVLLRDADLHLDSATGAVELRYADGRVARYTTRPAGIGRSIQEIYVAGGMEKWVAERL